MKLDKKNAKIAGVCAGMAKHLNMDIEIVRLLWVVIALLTGVFPAILVYIVLMMITKEEE